MYSFGTLIDTFKKEIKGGDFFVDWEKIYKSKKEYELLLNKLNFLLGNRELFRENFFFLLDKQPEVIEVFPVLLAIRDKNISYTKRNEILHYNFSRKHFLDYQEVENYYKFVTDTGLVKLFTDFNIKNLVDYVFGVEVGLDSNARKNRSGTLMETLVEDFIRDFCRKKGYQYKAQATAKWIQENWKLTVKSDKSERRFDFAVFNGKEVFLIETNFYGGGGSKLKAVAGEFTGLYHFLGEQGIKMFWVTDGLGWQTTLRPLEDAFNKTDGNIYNLHMLREGVLETLIK